MRYLLDTMVVSEGLRPAPDQGIMAGLEANRASLALAAPVWHELWFGCSRLPESRRRGEIETFLNGLGTTLPIVPYCERAALWHGTERARLEASGLTPPFVDGQIAAIAAVNGFTLVTRNGKDFEAFAGVRIEDWTA